MLRDVRDNKSWLVVAATAVAAAMGTMLAEGTREQEIAATDAERRRINCVY